MFWAGVTCAMVGAILTMLGVASWRTAWILGEHEWHYAESSPGGREFRIGAAALIGAAACLVGVVVFLVLGMLGV